MHFKREWFHEYGSGKCSCGKEHVLPRDMTLAITLDPAFSDGKSQKKKGSRSAIVVSGVGTDGHLYVLDTAAGQWSPYGTVEKLFEKIMFWRKTDPKLWVGIEETGGAQGIIAIFKSEMVRTGRRVPYRLIRPASRAKDSPDRIGPLHSHAEHWGIFLKESHDELREELLRFGVAERDDLADALAFRAMDLYMYARPTDEAAEDDTRKNLCEGRDYVDLDKMLTPKRQLNSWERILAGGNN